MSRGPSWSSSGPSRTSPRPSSWASRTCWLPRPISTSCSSWIAGSHRTGRDAATRNLEVRRCPSGRGRRARQPEEVAQERLALARQDGLRVELDTLHGQMPMAQAHDLAVLGPRGDLEHGGETLVEHHQRVVARGIEVLLELREDAAAIVMDAGGLAVHLLARPGHGAAERLADGLVPEADAENRRGRVEASDQPERDARAVWIARPRGDDDALGLESFYLVERDLVVARHVHAGAQLAHVLDEVVGERVVVIQHQNHDLVPPLCWDIR